MCALDVGEWTDNCLNRFTSVHMETYWSVENRELKILVPG
jgi:hypothetical protein